MNNSKKSKIKRHYYKAGLKNWKWDPSINEVDDYIEEIEKDFSEEQLKATLKSDKLKIIGYGFVGAISGCIGFIGHWLSAIIFIVSFAILGIICGFIEYYVLHYHKEYFEYLGDQEGFMEDTRLPIIFAEEIAKNKANKEYQEKLAAKWRKNHPLEEKIRLALTKNPNKIADLLKYCELVKPNKEIKQHIDANISKNSNTNNSKNISVKYLNNNKNKKKKP